MFMSFNSKFVIIFIESQLRVSLIVYRYEVFSEYYRMQTTLVVFNTLSIRTKPNHIDQRSIKKLHTKLNISHSI